MLCLCLPMRFPVRNDRAYDIVRIEVEPCRCYYRTSHGISQPVSEETTVSIDGEQEIPQASRRTSRQNYDREAIF